MFHTLFYQPLFNLLILFYVFFPGHDFGLAIILLTLVTKLLFYPLNNQALKTQKALNEIQPKLREIQEKFKNDKMEQARQTMALYREAKVSPFSSILPLLVQLPILFALYWVFADGLNPGSMGNLYSFIKPPTVINPVFLGIVDLSQPSKVLAVLAGAVQFLQTKLMAPKTAAKENKKRGSETKMAEIMQKEMLYFFPVLIIFAFFRSPSAVALYWLVSLIFSIIQQIFVNRQQTSQTYAQPRKL
ncbi:MAG: hypothetical protein COT34_02400 [Candidatus Nealsonbacteria bacterium CG08_land_8_20_14_0_20_43_11]|uniref:Membrane insertase YidC/Oxa/ALB C-terminal domain-containing protein n=1 Tax=Candidatus Nealsonbacteria bacterium CG08_land_8_20_14_0_20_43_11 TaxID=1974706 RepID=A0A2M6T0A3_9BACT|nr:MAG: hypothetical protein COT34_02400 [Candidatus Nealsonbacteria bacterium CG08_land_8_20_14_0_20_43_11]